MLGPGDVLRFGGRGSRHDSPHKESGRVQQSSSAPPTQKGRPRQLLPFEALRIPAAVNCQASASGPAAVSCKASAAREEATANCAGKEEAAAAAAAVAAEQYEGLASRVERAEQEQQQRHAEVMEQFQALRQVEHHEVVLEKLKVLQQVQQLQQTQMQQLQQRLQQKEVHQELQQQQELLRELQRELRQQRQQQQEHWQLRAEPPEQRRQQLQEEHRQLQADQPQQPEPQQQQHQDQQQLLRRLQAERQRQQQDQLQSLQEEQEVGQPAEHQSPAGQGPKALAGSMDLSPESLEILEGRLAVILDGLLSSHCRSGGRSGGRTLYGAPPPDPPDLAAINSGSGSGGAAIEIEELPRAPKQRPNIRVSEGALRGRNSSMHVGTWGSLLSFSVCLIILNAIFLGVEIDWNIDCARRLVPVPQWLHWISFSFDVAFTVETLLRVCSERRSFFGGESRWWNLFDVLLVVNGWISTTAEFWNLSGARLLRVLRLVRIARLLRGLTYLRKPRLIAASVLSSLPCVLWGFLLLATTLYMFAMIFLQSIEGGAWANKAVGDPLDTYYGSMGRTMLCLFQAISGGADWQVLLRPLEELSLWHLGPIFVFYVAFVLFFILNILVAIFVDGARQITALDTDLVTLDAADQERALLEGVRRYLPGAGKKYITRTELHDELGTLDSQQFFRGMGVDVVHVMRLYDLLASEFGVEKEELALTIVKLRTGATGVDVAMLMTELQRLDLLVALLMKDVAHGFGTVDADMKVLLHGTLNAMPPFTSQESIDGLHTLARFRTAHAMLSRRAVDEPTVDRPGEHRGDAQTCKVQDGNHHVVQMSTH